MSKDAVSCIPENVGMVPWTLRRCNTVPHTMSVSHQSMAKQCQLTHSNSNAIYINLHLGKLSVVADKQIGNYECFSLQGERASLIMWTKSRTFRRTEVQWHHGPS